MSECLSCIGEGVIVEDLVRFKRQYSSIKFPLSSEAKKVLDHLLDPIGGLPLLCDDIFGTFIDAEYNRNQTRCYMDLADVSPHSRLATALFQLISAGTQFATVLEAVSYPSPTFASQLRKEWKSSQSSPAARGANSDSGAPLLYRIDFPLSSFMQNSFRLLSETKEADLYSFTRNKIPGALLLPFWQPPLMTRKEPCSHQVMTSLPCSPLSYFILRMLVYIARRSEKDGAAILSYRQYHGVRSCIRALGDGLAWLTSRLPPTEFPFLSTIVTTYIQMYVTSSLPKNIACKITIEDVQWTTTDTIASLLISSSFLLCHRHVVQPCTEVSRKPIHDPSYLAPVVMSAPFLAEMYVSLHRGVSLVSEQAGSTVSQGFDDDTTFKAADDILYIKQTLYRNALITLREVFLSLDGFKQCRYVHFNNAMELWLTLMNPQWRVNGKVGFNYVTRHYEAYGCLAIGFLNMAVKSNMIGAVDSGGLELFFKCLSILSDSDFASAADVIHSAITAKVENVVMSAIRRNCVLNWSDEACMTSMMDVRHENVSNKAAQLFVSIEAHCAKEDDPFVNRRYRDCMSAIVAAFPGANVFLGKWREVEATADAGLSRRVNSNPHSGADNSSLEAPLHCLTEEQKRKFFTGKMRSLELSQTKARLPTNNGRVHGGHHPALQSAMYLELPMLIGPTRYLDAGIEKVMEWYYSAWMPKCDGGHHLCLLGTDKFACSNHSSSPAIWECAICERVYGVCCCTLPMSSQGTQLEFCKAPHPSFLCTNCSAIITENGVCYVSLGGDDRVFCPDCASRPFKLVSTRFLAAYSTWAIAIIALILYQYLISYFRD